jgi:hypothetical protein
MHEIYGVEAFNKADNQIEDSPSLPNATQGKKMRQGSEKERGQQS